jgi:ABC-type amino acid transport substrate-binding protein
MFTRPDLRVPDELRGARVGVTRFGSSTDVVGRLLLRRWGLDPERDVAMLQLGGVPEMFGALQNGALDAAVLSDPNSLQAAKQGYPVAADAGELSIPYMHLGTVVTRKVLAERPDLLRRYLLAYQAGINRFFADGPFAQRMLGQYTHQDDPEVLEGTYRVYADRYISRDVRPSPETIATILAADTNPRVRELAADALVDDTLARQLQAEGAIPTGR